LAAPDFPDPYCSAEFSGVEPISRVTFAGQIDNSSAADSYLSLEDFTHIHALVTVGETYPVMLEGNTAGNYRNYFKVYVDWDHDGIFADSETTVLDDSVYNSTGDDGQQASGLIEVPATAVSGVPRMRVVKHYYLDQGGCGQVGF